MNEYSVRSSDETIGDKSEIVQKESNICLKSAPISSTIGSKEPSTEELSSKKSLTDLKPIIIKSENKACGGEVSVEIPISEFETLKNNSFSLEKMGFKKFQIEVSVLTYFLKQNSCKKLSTWGRIRTCAGSTPIE